MQKYERIAPLYISASATSVFLAIYSKENLRTFTSYIKINI